MPTDDTSSPAPSTESTGAPTGASPGASPGASTLERSAALDDAGRLLLRASLAALMLLHGVAKLQHGVSGIATMLERKGLPGAIAPAVFVGEALAPLAMILGLFTRPAALVFAFNMLVATWLVHAGDVARLSTTGGWKIELQMLYLVGALSVALLGPGRWSASRGAGPWWR